MMGLCFYKNRETHTCTGALPAQDEEKAGRGTPGSCHVLPEWSGSRVNGGGLAFCTFCWVPVVNTGINWVCQGLGRV